MRCAMTWFLRLPLCVSLLALAIPQALGNGINPPRPAGGENVIVQCTARDGGNITTVFRVLLLAPQPSHSVEIKIGDRELRLYALTEVSGLAVPSEEVSADGLADATIELADSSYRGAGQIKVVSDSKAVRLTGFTKDQQRIDMPLAGCAQLKVIRPTSAGDSGVREPTLAPRAP